MNQKSYIQNHTSNIKNSIAGANRIRPISFNRTGELNSPIIIRPLNSNVGAKSIRILYF